MSTKASLKNLIQQKTTWHHLPTRAIRIPAIFADQILEIARDLDKGMQPIAVQAFESYSLDQLIDFQKQLPELIRIKKESSYDRSLEAAITYLASLCDGAYVEDGKGFNKCDADFGRYLASQIQAKKLIKSHAEKGLKMIQKYKRQLEGANLTLPTWDAIQDQYPETSKKIERGGDNEEIPAFRVETKRNQIAVYAPYDSSGKFQAKAKSIEGYRFDRDDKGWYYPNRAAIEIAKAFPQSEYEWDDAFFGAIELAKLEIAKAESAKEKEADSKSSEIVALIEAADLDAPLKGWYLRDYQKEGVKWLLSRHKQALYCGGILADDMGLGKTLTALVAAKAMQKIYNCHIFVISPISLADNWLREADRVGVGIEVFSNNHQKIPAPVSQSYLVIADEAHGFQNEKSKRTELMMDLVKHENCIGSWLLTGTPIKNGRPINLLPLLSMLGHPLTENRWEYLKKYCAAHQKSIGRGRTAWDMTGAAHLDELSKKTEDIILRRTKDQCLKELPPKTRLYLPIELESKQKLEYDKNIKELVVDYRRRVEEGTVDEGAEALVTLNYLRKVGSQFKVEAAIEWAEELLEQGQQVVLFIEFVESAKQLHEKLGGELLTGETPADQRQAMVDRFQSGESKIFIGTIKAGGVGITLTAASHLCLVDRAWTPGDCSQAEDRIHRLGQQNAAFITWLQMGFVDVSIDNLLLQKQQRIELVLRGKRKTLKGIDSARDLARELLALL